MNMNEFQDRCLTTTIYPNKGNNPAYTALGLCGESGEVAEKVKKLYRDSGGVLTEAIRDAIKKELGDVLWYASAMAFECGLTLQDAADSVLIKLSDRAERGVLSGSGDNR